MTCGILVPWPGIEPTPLLWKHGILTSGLPGKLLKLFFRKPHPGTCHSLSTGWKRISRHRVFQKRVSLWKTKSRDNAYLSGEQCLSFRATSWKTRKRWYFSWVRSQFWYPQDKENSCWRSGIRWLVRVGTFTSYGVSKLSGVRGTLGSGYNGAQSVPEMTLVLAPHQWPWYKVLHLWPWYGLHSPDRDMRARLFTILPTLCYHLTNLQ